MKQVMALDAGWELWGADPAVQRASSERLADGEVFVVDLPEDVHETLRREGKLPDFNVGDHFLQYQWVNDRDWTFQKRFRLPSDWDAERSVIVFGGIDLLGEVRLNGALLGKTENAFLPVRFDVTGLLRRDADNVLAVRIASLAKRLGRTAYTGLLDDWRSVRTLVRKPQFAFGWDWAPNMPPVGLDRVRLEGRDEYEIIDAYIRPKIDGRAQVFVEINDRLPKEGGTAIEVTIGGHGFAGTKLITPTHPRITDEGADVSELMDQRVQAARFFTGFRVKKPKLWWPNGYGEAALYDWRVRLLRDGEEIDCREGRFGFREVRIHESFFTPNGMTWGIEINGRKVLVRGANWVPTRIFPYLQQDADYHAMLARAREAHFNMVRVWGGGIYEREAFYDTCDENGIMVWQDFMFASAVYGIPDDAFRKSVIAEAEHHVRRLRNRPSVVLWCGCNEDSFSWSYRGEVSAGGDGGMWAEAATDRAALHLQEKELLSMILRGTVSRLTEEPFVESSPQSHSDFGNDAPSGNGHLSCHKYSIHRGAEAFREHFRAIQSFDSEFCIQGPACLETLEAFLPPEHRWPPDEVWTTHVMRSHNGVENHAYQLRYARELFGEADTLEDFIRKGQAVHAEFARAECECIRHWRGKSGGAMVWMLNDCWPTSNWSIVDFFDRPKPAFYAMKRACAPTVLVLFPTGDGRTVTLTLCNQSSRKLAGTVRWGQMGLDGRIVSQERKEISVGAFASSRVAMIRPQDARDTFLWTSGELGDVTIERTTYFPWLWKHVNWPEPELSAEIVFQEKTESGNVTRVRVRARRFARFVHLHVEPAAGKVLSDNYFDLAGGDEKIVEIRSTNKLIPADVRAGHWLNWRG